MGPKLEEKKRKALATTASMDAPQKKLKKQKTATSHVPIETAEAINQSAVLSKQNRKRAADFMNEDEADDDLPMPKFVNTTTSENSEKPKKRKTKQSIENKMGLATDVVSAPAPEGTVKIAKDQAQKKVVEAPSRLKKGTSTEGAAADRLERLLSTPVLEWHETKRRTDRLLAKKAKKAEAKGHTLTADGANGVQERSEDEDVDTITANEKVSMSMQAEGQRTVDREMKEEADSEDEDQEEIDDNGAALLAGFDSDTEDPAKDDGLDLKNIGGPEMDKKQRKKLRRAAHKGGEDTPGTIYVGRVPHGFYEPQMREYFSQFGVITKIRLSRNRKTGASKHFAFIEFQSAEVAKIAAEAMDNYLMFGHILKCKYAETESLHPDVWKGANKRFKKVPFNKIEARRLQEPKTVDQWETKIAREQKKREEKAKDIKKKMGYEYELPKIQGVSDVLERKKLAQTEGPKLLAPATPEGEPAEALEPPNSIPKDDFALAKGNTSKKIKKEKDADKPVASNPDVKEETTQVAETAGPILSKGQRKRLNKQKKVTAAKGDATEKSDKVAKKIDRTEEQAAVQKQLNAQLNGVLAAQPSDNESDMSGPDVLASSNILPTAAGDGEISQRKRSKPKTKNIDETGEVTAPLSIPSSKTEEPAPSVSTKTEKSGKVKKRKSEGDFENAVVDKKSKKAKKTSFA